MWTRFQQEAHLLYDAVGWLQGRRPRTRLAVDTQTQLHGASRYPAKLGT